MTLTLNRERRRILAAAGRGRVTRGATGVGIYLRGSGTTGSSGRCDNAVKQMVDAGWLQLAADGSTYEPTVAGWEQLGGRPCVNCTDPACKGCWGADTHRVDDWRP